MLYVTPFGSKCHDKITKAFQSVWKKDVDFGKRIMFRDGATAYLFTRTKERKKSIEIILLSFSLSLFSPLSCFVYVCVCIEMRIYGINFF